MVVVEWSYATVLIGCIMVRIQRGMFRWRSGWQYWDICNFQVFIDYIFHHSGCVENVYCAAHGVSRHECLTPPLLFLMRILSSIRSVVDPEIQQTFCMWSFIYQLHWLCFKVDRLARMLQSCSKILNSSPGKDYFHTLVSSFLLACTCTVCIPPGAGAFLSQFVLFWRPVHENLIFFLNGKSNVERFYHDRSAPAVDFRFCPIFLFHIYWYGRLRYLVV